MSILTVAALYGFRQTNIQGHRKPLWATKQRPGNAVSAADRRMGGPQERLYDSSTNGGSDREGVKSRAPKRRNGCSPRVGRTFLRWRNLRRKELAQRGRQEDRATAAPGR